MALILGYLTMLFQVKSLYSLECGVEVIIIVEFLKSRGKSESSQITCPSTSHYKATFSLTELEGCGRDLFQCALWAVARRHWRKPWNPSYKGASSFDVNRTRDVWVQRMGKPCASSDYTTNRRIWGHNVTIRAEMMPHWLPQYWANVLFFYLPLLQCLQTAAFPETGVLR
jgi:hypothetical protein